MQYTLALLALVAAVSAQSAASPPSGCLSTFSGNFEIAPVNVSSQAKRDVLGNFKRATSVACSSNPIIDLTAGKLLDQSGRTGEIVANHQFQFDNPTQSGALFTSGFSVCPNNTLALGGSTIFYGCKSGSFSNLYDASLGLQCYEIYIDVIPCVGGPSNTAVVSSAASTASSSTSAVVSSTTSSTSMTPIVMTMPSAVPTTASTTSLPPPAIVTSATAPYPVTGNATVPAASGTASSTGSKPATSSPVTAPASGAGALAVGGKIVAAAVGFVAFAML